MKRGFARPTPEKPPVIKPENIVLSTPLSIPPPEGKPWWLIVVGVVVVGLLGGMVAMVFASGSHVFGGIGSIFPLFMMVGIMMMMFRGMGGGQQQMSRPKLDAMRSVHVDAGHAARDGPRVGRQHGRQLSVVPPGAQYVGGRRGVTPDVGAQARR